MPRNFPAVLIIFTGRVGAGNPPSPQCGAGNPPLPAGRVPRGAGRPSLVCYTFSAISSGHSACQNHKILNSGCRHVNTQHGGGGCGMKCDSNTYSGSIVISADWRGPSWYRYLLQVKSPTLNKNSCKTFMSYFWLLLHLATNAKYQRSFPLT